MTKDELLAELMRCQQLTDQHAARILSWLEVNQELLEQTYAYGKRIARMLEIVRQLPIAGDADLEELR